MINDSIVRRWWDLFRADTPLTEARILAKSGKQTYESSGYFKDVDSFLAAIKCYQKPGQGIYSPINEIDEYCYSLAQHDKILDKVEKSTADKDITGRKFFFVDLDPIRPTGVNSTDEELGYAKEKLREVGVFLRDLGFESPIVAMSGNGYHLYYRIHLLNNDENTLLVKNCLEVLDMMFSDDRVKIDLANSNASRIAKVIGTKSPKGADTEERPQRLSHFVQVPQIIKATETPYLKKLAALLPVPEEPPKANNLKQAEFRGSFNLDEFLDKYHIEVHHKSNFSAGVKYVLKECPFNPEHKSPDSAIFVMNTGAIGFRCLHNSCSQYTWKDVRLKYEPDAYDRKDYESYQQKQYRSLPKPPPTIVPESPIKGKKWKEIGDIEYIDPSTFVHIKTGINKVDDKTGGMMLGDVTIVSGYPGSGKSSLLNYIVLNAVNDGYKAAIWSGELQDFRFQSWLDQAAAGKNFVKFGKGRYFAPEATAKKINDWLRGKVYLYNNEYGNKFSQLLADIKEIVTEKGTQLIVLDNLTALSLDLYDGEKVEKQSAFINELRTFAQQANIHIVLVAHPRKEMGFAFLRMESISGSADLYNLVANILIVHRTGRDFEARAKSFLRSDEIDDLAKYDTVVEVAKNRDLGDKDLFVGLYFETESRRFKNTIDEYIVYGWQDGYKPQIPQELPPPPTPQIPTEPTPEPMPEPLSEPKEENKPLEPIRKVTESDFDALYEKDEDADWFAQM